MELCRQGRDSMESQVHSTAKQPGTAHNRLEDRGMYPPRVLCVFMRLQVATGKA